MKQLIEERLDQLIPKSGRLYEAARYTLLSTAKRIRPLLLLTGAQSYGVPIKQALDPACALEMIHTYSLIHDDLPAMDDDLLRRGLPTLHIQFDEATAILAGDYLLTYAFEVIANAPDISIEGRLELISHLAKGSGGEGMIGGQILDITQDRDTHQMHEKKTAALFRTAMQCVATLAGATEQEQLAAFGTHFGLLFQLIDDLIDRDHPDGETMALERTSYEYDRASAILRDLPIDTTPLESLLNRLYNKRCLVS